MHEKAPKEFVNTFNSAWDIGFKFSILAGIVLLALFFYGLYDSFAALFATLIFVALAYGGWKLYAALFIGPVDPDSPSEESP